MGTIIVNKIDWQEVKHMYINLGLTFKEIGHKFGCGSGPIRKIAKRHGIKPIRGKSKHRKILVQKSSLPLSITETKIWNKMDLPLSRECVEMLMGSLLGDASIRVRRNKRKRDGYNVNFAQSEKQLDFLKWKHEFFGEYANPIRKEGEARETMIKGKKYYRQAIHCFSSKPFDLSIIYDMLTRNGVKVVKPEYLSCLTPLSLATWYMDDGSYGCINGTIRIATMGFSVKCNNILKNYFYNNLKMPCILDKTNCGCGYSLTLTQNSSKKFLQLIYPYRCPSMDYKFPEDHKFPAYNKPNFLNPSETSKANNFVSREMPEMVSNIAGHLCKRDDGIVQASMKVLDS